MKRLVEASKWHWTELWDNYDDDYDVFKGYTNRQVFEWYRSINYFKTFLTFSKDVKAVEDLVLGKKLAEVCCSC